MRKYTYAYSYSKRVKIYVFSKYKILIDNHNFQEKNTNLFMYVLCIIIYTNNIN